MRATRQIATGVAISNLSGLSPSGRKPEPLHHVDHHDELHAESLPPQERRDHGDETPEPANTELTVAQAVEILEPIAAQRQIVTRYRDRWRKVARLRNDLQKAQRELAAVEAELIREAQNGAAARMRS